MRAPWLWQWPLPSLFCLHPYCNTGSLSAQARFALSVAGWDNLRILQGGMEEWTAQVGFTAVSRAEAAAGTRRH